MCTLPKIRHTSGMILPNRILHFVQNDKGDWGGSKKTLKSKIRNLQSAIRPMR
jgi:hypothetical protein